MADKPPVIPYATPEPPAKRTDRIAWWFMADALLFLVGFIILMGAYHERPIGWSPPPAVDALITTLLLASFALFLFLMGWLIVGMFRRAGPADQPPATSDRAYAFKLAWRWTQPSHTILPPDVMAQIIPLEHADAPPGFLVQDQLIPSAIEDHRSTRTDAPPQTITDWLAQLPVAPSTPIIIRWDQHTAIQTTWDIFTRFWNAFCYPSSDNIGIFPPSAEWIMLYHHHELFEWARRRQT